MASNNNCRCTCLPNEEWTPKLDEYVAQRVHEFRETQDDFKLSLMALKDHPLAKQGLPTPDVRLLLEQEIPTKTTYCKSPTMCCGQCARQCSSRCPQDLLQKLQLLAYSEPAVRKALQIMEPCTYRKLIELFNDYLRDSARKGQHGKYNCDYSPSINYTETDTPGVYKAELDQNTLLIRVLNWPNSGLCPFCLPKQATQVYKRGPHKPHTGNPGGRKKKVPSSADYT